jgi:hypothetical protein
VADSTQFMHAISLSDYQLVLMANEKALLVVCTDRARSSNGVVYSKAFGLEISQVDPTWKTNAARSSSICQIKYTAR